MHQLLLHMRAEFVVCFEATIQANCSCSHYVAGTGASPEPSIILFSPLPMLPLNHPLQPSKAYGPTSTLVINPWTPKLSSLSITSPTRSHFLQSFLPSVFFFVMLLHSVLSPVGTLAAGEFPTDWIVFCLEGFLIFLWLHNVSLVPTKFPHLWGKNASVLCTV